LRESWQGPNPDPSPLPELPTAAAGSEEGVPRRYKRDSSWKSGWRLRCSFGRPLSPLRVAAGAPRQDIRGQGGGADETTPGRAHVTRQTTHGRTLVSTMAVTQECGALPGRSSWQKRQKAVGAAQGRDVVSGLSAVEELAPSARMSCFFACLRWKDKAPDVPDGDDTVEVSRRMFCRTRGRRKDSCCRGDGMGWRMLDTEMLRKFAKCLQAIRSINCLNSRFGGRDGIRTRDPWLRRPVLYPAELPALEKKYFYTILILNSSTNWKKIVFALLEEGTPAGVAAVLGILLPPHPDPLPEGRGRLIA
jgi:hypothetical protein